MDRIKKFFNTLFVFTGNILRLKPTSWKASEKTAESMATCAQMDIFTGTDGEPATQTPIGYLIDSVLNVLALALGIWLISKIIAGFFAMLPYLLAIAFIAWLISFLTPSQKGDAVAS